MKPFRTRDGRVIVDQVCRCGHRFSQHGYRLASLPDQVVPVSQHGPCLERDCTCERFTFAGFVFQEAENNPAENMPAEGGHEP